MKIACKFATQVPGHGIVRKGQHIDWPDKVEFPPQVLGNFVYSDSGAPLQQPAQDGKAQKPKPQPKDGSAQELAEKNAKAALIAGTAKLGKQKLIAALDNAGVTYKANASATDLAKALLRSQGQDVD